MFVHILVACYPHSQTAKSHCGRFKRHVHRRRRVTAESRIITLNIYKSPVRVELVLESWGNVSMTYQPVQCVDNIMYIYEPNFGHLLVLSFQATEASISL